MQENKDWIKSPWSQEYPIENLFDQIEKVIEHAKYGNSPFKNNQILNITYLIMSQDRMFKDACLE